VWALLVLVGLFGLAIGSFLNVVVYRVPLGLSLVSPPSRCPSCDHDIRNRHNVPVAGWLVLRGRCADCAARISPRYPLVELATGVLFVALALRLRHLGLSSALPAYLWFAAVGLALALIDLDVRRLPNTIVLPSYPVIGVLLAVSSWTDHDWGALLRAGLGAAALFGFFLGLALLYPKGMGFGDVKLAGLLGAVLGYLSWSAVLVGGFLGFLLGALVGILVIARGQGTRKTALPFGPFMIAGALIAIFSTPGLVSLYLDAVRR